MLGALAKTKKGEMKLLAGTSKGLFEIVNGSANLVLNAKGVREIVRLERDIFAGTSQGLFVSSDLGVHWSGPDMADYTVWQVRPGYRWHSLCWNLSGRTFQKYRCW